MIITKQFSDYSKLNDFSLDYELSIQAKMFFKFVEINSFVNFDLIFYVEDKKILGAVLFVGNLLANIFIDRSLEGKGIGGLLMKELFTLATSKKLVSITTKVMPHTVKFYEKNGFEKISDEKTSGNILLNQVTLVKKVL